jgi:subtilisin family serine protease
MKNLLKFIVVITVIFQLQACNNTEEGDEPIVDSDLLIRSLIKDEPYFKYAWHLAYDSDFAQDFNIDKESHIHIEEAWEITRGAGVIVAVLDAGSFDSEHEDLKENVIATYNADEHNSDVSNTTDNFSHGSTVAGFVASPANGKGLVGAAPEAKLLLIKQAYADDGATIEAFKYAKDKGAKIINCSWGTNNASEVIVDYMQQLKDEGITIIFASGNNGCNMDQYFIVNSYGDTICTESSGIPINDESEAAGVIGVGASSEFNDITPYSNYGQNIDLIAPGGNLELSSGILGIDDTGVFGDIWQRGLVDDNYSFTSGTSLSAPITTGVVALMLSVNPSLMPEQIREILIKSSDKIGETSNYINGFDIFRAYGKLNAATAVQMAQDY